jgi:hypothetical protein
MNDAQFPSIMDAIQEQLDPVHAAKLKVLNLFCEIREKLGDARTRRIFAIWEEPPSASKLARHKNYAAQASETAREGSRDDRTRVVFVA